MTERITGVRAAHDYLMRKELAAARRGNIRTFIAFAVAAIGLMLLAYGFSS